MSYSFPIYGILSTDLPSTVNLKYCIFIFITPTLTQFTYVIIWFDLSHMQYLPLYDSDIFCFCVSPFTGPELGSSWTVCFLQVLLAYATGPQVVSEGQRWVYILLFMSPHLWSVWNQPQLLDIKFRISPPMPYWAVALVFFSCLNTHVM